MKNKNKKLKLEAIKIKSFATNLSKENQNYIKGGSPVGSQGRKYCAM